MPCCDYTDRGSGVRVEHIGDATLYLGDCTEVMQSLDPVDGVITDPPYGLGNRQTEKNNYATFEDEPEIVKNLVLFVLSWSGTERFILTPGQAMMFNYPEPNAIGVFYYPVGTGSCAWGFVGWQPIFYYGKDPRLQDGKGRASNSFYATDAAEKNGHPCPKPIGQWQKLVRRGSRFGETILDPFMGSGTTGVACAKLGRKFIGIEIDSKYFDIACERISEAYEQPDMFIEPPAKPIQEAMDLCTKA